jgi:hypothetical protein
MRRGQAAVVCAVSRHRFARWRRLARSVKQASLTEMATPQGRSGHQERCVGRVLARQPGSRARAGEPAGVPAMGVSNEAAKRPRDKTKSAKEVYYARWHAKLAAT